MARKTPSNANQTSLFPGAPPKPDSRPAEAPRRLPDGRGAAGVAARVSRAVKSPPEASTKEPPADLVKTLPWCRLTPEEVSDFEAATGRKVVRGAFRLEMKEDGRLVPVWRVRFAPR
jgi:hypothetical protein